MPFQFPPAMFGIFPVIRFSQSAAVLLLVGLVVSAGCQWLSPRSSTTTPLVSSPVPQEVYGHLPKMNEPDRYEAFRPVMPELFAPPILVQESLVQESPKIEPQLVIADQSDIVSDVAQFNIDELNRRIIELEAQLEEARQIPPPVNFLDLPLPDVLPEEKKEVRMTRSLPIINKRGVNVYADESNYVRIEVSDKFLFMPHTWQLTAEGEETLRVIAAELRAFDSQSILDIEGHTDSLMGDPNNPMQKHEISTEKTKIIMDFFVNALRWDTAQIGTSSFGRNRPIADNGTPEGRARNNRIEIVIRNGNE